jgi:hypothetical protein
MKKIIYWTLGILAFLILLIAVAGFIKFNFTDGGDVIPDEKVEYVGTDLIHVFYPQNDNKIISPLIIKGEARGNWYFEASFPVVLTNWDGLIIADGIAQAEGEWMTTNFVPFTATLNFEKPSYGERGFLILQKDNPSGLPQHDDAFEIPIYFK